MDDRTRSLRAQAHALEPVMQVGKNGVTQGTLELLDRELRQRRLVKVKLLKGALGDDAGKAGRKGLAQQLADATRSKLIDQVGSMVVLYR